jgi:uncharacterized protein YpiB (UPF0302 family)
LGNTISLSLKREFVSWFLVKHTLQKREAAWLLSYLTSDDRLLEKVHFVDSVYLLNRFMIISATEIVGPAFEFHKNSIMTPDVEKAFHDLRLHSQEDVYVQILFKNRAASTEYAAVLEGNPMEKQDVVHETVLGLLAEMVWEEAIRSYREQRIYAEIDHTLQVGDEKKFMELTQELKQLKR